MEIRETKESKLLGRREVLVLFKEKAGALTRRDAVKEVAQEMKVEEKRVGLISLYSQAGTRSLVGRFHVYDSEESMKSLHHDYLSVRLLTKEEREKLKQEKKKAQQPKAK